MQSRIKEIVLWNRNTPLEGKFRRQRREIKPIIWHNFKLSRDLYSILSVDPAYQFGGGRIQQYSLEMDGEEFWYYPPGTVKIHGEGVSLYEKY